MSRRTAPLMMALALIAAVAGIAVWLDNGGILWLIGALLMVGMFPFTAIFIVPTNVALLKVDAAATPDEAEALHARWGVRHTWRTVIGAPAFLLFLWAISGRGV